MHGIPRDVNFFNAICPNIGDFVIVVFYGNFVMEGVDRAVTYPPYLTNRYEMEKSPGVTQTHY